MAGDWYLTSCVPSVASGKAERRCVHTFANFRAKIFGSPLFFGESGDYCLLLIALSYFSKCKTAVIVASSYFSKHTIITIIYLYNIYYI